MGERKPDYVHGACPNCGRVRLMPHFDGDKLIGIECEKCHMCWPMNEETGHYASPYGGWPHPITGESADTNDSFSSTQPVPDDLSKPDSLGG